MATVAIGGTAFVVDRAVNDELDYFTNLFRRRVPIEGEYWHKSTLHFFTSYMNM